MPLLTGLVILFAYTTFFSAYTNIDQEVLSTLNNEDIVQIEQRHSALWASHFFDHYAVVTPIEAAAETADGQPVFIDEPNTRYAWVLTTYMDELGIAYEQFGNPSQLPETEVILLLSYPDHSLESIQEIYPAAQCSPLSAVSIFRAMRCELK